MSNKGNNVSGFGVFVQFISAPSLAAFRDATRLGQAPSSAISALRKEQR